MKRPAEEHFPPRIIATAQLERMRPDSPQTERAGNTWRSAATDRKMASWPRPSGSSACTFSKSVTSG
jgi:hypothetical protein